VFLGEDSGRAVPTAGALGKLVTEKPVDFVGFDNVVEFNKNRQNGVIHPGGV
jgi:hypothetical protein